MEHRLVGPDVKKYITAGYACFTVRNANTGNRFTYRVKMPRNVNKYSPNVPIRFVSVLMSHDNSSSYRYIGFTRNGEFVHGGQRAFANRDAQSVKAFGWVWNHINALPDCIEVWHEGHCGRCGRKLTVPESIASGIGPECIKRV